jgi:hypothetical protein
MVLLHSQGSIESKVSTGLPVLTLRFRDFFYPCTLQRYIIFSPQTRFSWRIIANTFVHFGKNPKFAQENAFFLFFWDTMSYFFLNIINIRPVADRKKPFPMSVVPI